MRRKDREVTDTAEMLKILEKCEVCRLGFAEPEGVYIVPMSFGYSYCDGGLTLYFHGAAEGKKAALLEVSPIVGFEMDIPGKLSVSENACGYSYMYQSIVGKGRAEIISDPADKNKAMRRIMYKYSTREDWSFDENVFRRTMLFKVEVKEWSCKFHL